MNISDILFAKATGGGSGGYDIIIDAGSSLSNNVSDYTVLRFDFEKVKEKLRKGELVTGCLIRHWNYDASVDGDTSMDIIPLVTAEIFSNGGGLAFSRVTGMGQSSPSQAKLNIKRATFTLTRNGELQTVIGEQRDVTV